jgi:hypothetical protein
VKVWKRFVTPMLAAGLVLAASPPVFGQVVISNGTIALGVNPTGDLNVYYPTTLNPNGVGVEYLPTGNDGTSYGCPCEGWGAAVVGGAWSGTSGWADQATGTANLLVTSFPTTAMTAISTVNVMNGGTPVLQVVQNYHPSIRPDLFQVDVTMTNLTGGDLGSATNGIRYRRLMDWDIAPTAFDEYVTIQGWPATNLLATSDDGFMSGDPLSSPGGICAANNVNFVDSGPCDHGALFDFGFNGLAAGASRSFTIFYGAAGTEAAALADLGAVGAEVYSLGQCDHASNATCSQITGTPNTFIFGFQGVGGTPVSTTPEPATMVLLGTGLAGIGALMRKRSAA